MPTDDLDRFCCQNPDCAQYGRRGAGDLSVCGHYVKAHHRLLDCNACKDHFSEFKGTPLLNSKLPHDKVLDPPAPRRWLRRPPDCPAGRGQ